VPVETLRVELLGASFTIQTDESRAYLESIVAELRRRYASVRRGTGVDDPLKVSILAAIYLVDELSRAAVDSAVGGELAATADAELGKVAERLIARIDQSLGGDQKTRPGHNGETG